MKVSEAGDIVPSAVLLEDIPMVTLAEGWEVSLTVKVVVWPIPEASVVVNPLVGLTVKPATSLSLFVAVTSLGLIAL